MTEIRHAPFPSNSHALGGTEDFLQRFDRVLRTFARNLVAAMEEVEDRHNRAELLAAYRRRHAWKRSDIPHLRTLGVSETARKRMERLPSKGRPVVRSHRPLGAEFLARMAAVQPLFDSASTPNERRRALKHWPWWPHYVEALYRGEHELAKRKGVPGPSNEAKIMVGKALGISAATVHSICCEIRGQRKECEDSANFPAMTLVEYEEWMRSGNDSEYLKKKHDFD